MTPEQATALRDAVVMLRRTLPDPTARDVADAVMKMAELAPFATPSRVKKVCTQLNRAARAPGFDSCRDGTEPDETDGPLVMDELGTWPTDASLEAHLSTDPDARIFRASEHHVDVHVDGAGDVMDVSDFLSYRRALAALARFHDSSFKVWKVADPGETSELVLVCTAVRWWRSEAKGKDGEEMAVRAVLQLEYVQGNPRSGAHRRLVASLLAKHAGEVGEHRATLGAQSIMLTHLRRNRHYEDKYSRGCGGSAAEGGEAKMLSSYVVTPAPEWFRSP